MENAVRFTKRATEMNFNAQYAINPGRQIYYVYVYSTTVRKDAFEFATRVRNESLYKDCWVFEGKLGMDQQESGVDQDVATSLPVNVEPKDTAPKVSSQPQPAPAETAPDTVVTAPVEEKPTTPPPTGKKFLFKLTSAVTGSEIDGLIRLQESDQAAQFRGYPSNEEVYIEEPNNRSGKWVIKSRVVGYRQFKDNISYLTPPEPDPATGAIVVPIQLERVKKGDYVELDSVKFYNNAASLLPSSRGQLMELVNLLNENPGYEIKIHGHVNGKQKREMITRQPDEDLFTLVSSNKRVTVSAKTFSRRRAEIVEQFLKNEGINSSRMKVVAEGAVYSIYKGTLAGYNDRIEIEITRD